VPVIEPWVLDLDGVIWLGDEPIPGASAAVGRLQEVGAPVLFVTNMSRLTETEQEAKLASHGIDATGAVLTSAMAAGSYVEAGDRVVVVGGHGIDEAVEKRGGRVVRSGPAELVIVGIDPSFDYDELGRAMLAVRGGARLVGTNHDPTYPTAEGLKPGGGSIVAAIAAAAEVEPIFAGKPHATAADQVRARLGDRGLMVGDRPDSDGLFARQLGYNFGLVLSGVTSADDLPVEPTPAVVADDLASLVSTRLERS
jgi:HAD superfamily hydrolase (TIGR01450 family)